MVLPVLTALFLSQTCPVAPTPASNPTPRTWTVSNSGTDPSTCSGATSTQVWRNIQKAVQCALPGDTIQIRAGKWYERLTIQAVGGPGKPITITNYPGEVVSIDGNGAISDFAAIVTFDNAHYVTLSGVDIGNTGYTAGVNTGGYGIVTIDSSNITIKNSKIHDTARNGIILTGCDLTFQDNEVTRASLRNENGVSPNHDGGVNTAVQTASGYPTYNVTLARNYIHDIWGECLVALHADTVSIKGNRVHDCWSVNVYLDHARNALVDGNYIYRTNAAFDRASVGGPAAGIQIANEDYTGSSQVHYTPRYQSKLTITNNLISKCGQGVRWWNSSYNVASTTYGDVLVAHNTIHSILLNPIMFDAPPASATRGTNLAILNNLVFASTGNGGFTMSLDGGTGAWDVRGNVFPDGVPSGYSTGNFSVAVPGLVGPVTAGSNVNGWKVPDGSGLTGKGVPVPEVSTDYFGRERHVLAPTPGFYESTATTPSTTIRQYGSTGSDAYSAFAVSGTDYYAAGYRGSSAYLTRMTSAGTVVWSKSVGSGAATGVVVSLDGSVVTVAGTSGSGGFLSRYTKDGTQLTLRTTPAPINAMTSDADGMLYLVGSTTGNLALTSFGGTDAWVQQLDSLGRPVWTRQLGGSGNDVAWAVAVDEIAVYVAGGTTGAAAPGKTNAGLEDAFLTRYAKDGTRSWTTQWGTASNDRARGVSASAGRVTIVGDSSGALGGASAGGVDCFVGQFRRDNGTVQWNKQVGFSGTDGCSGTYSEPDGTMYVAGSFSGNAGTGYVGGIDAFLVRYDLNGTRAFIEYIGTAGTDVALAVLPGGYVVGSTDGATTAAGANGGGTDFLWGKLAP